MNKYNNIVGFINFLLTILLGSVILGTVIGLLNYSFRKHRADVERKEYMENHRDVIVYTPTSWSVDPNTGKTNVVFDISIKTVDKNGNLVK